MTLRNEAHRRPEGADPFPHLDGTPPSAVRRYIDEIGIDHHVLFHGLLGRVQLFGRILLANEQRTVRDIVHPAAGVVHENDASVEESIGDDHLHCIR